MRDTGLPIIVRLDGKPVTLVGDGEAAAAKRRLLERAGAVVLPASDDARLAIVALEDGDAAAGIAAALKAQGKLVNVVDRPELCDFTLPAIVDRSPVLVAIATGGASAGLAAALRQRLETLLPQRLGLLATALAAARGAMRTRFPEGRARRNAIAQALIENGPLDPLVEHDDEAVALWLAGDAAARLPRLVRIDLVSADPDRLTLRAARMLAQADRVYHRPGVPPAILDRARADAMRIACARPPVHLEDGLSVDVAFDRHSREGGNP